MQTKQLMYECEKEATRSAQERRLHTKIPLSTLSHGFRLSLNLYNGGGGGLHCGSCFSRQRADHAMYSHFAIINALNVVHACVILSP